MKVYKFNTVYIYNDRLKAIFLPLGLWCLWGFFLVSLLYSFFSSGTKGVDLILFTAVLGCVGLFLPLNILVIDKKKRLINIKQKHFLTMVGSTHRLEVIKELEIKNGLGSTGNAFLSINVGGDNVELIGPDILPGHVKKIVNIRTIIEHFLSNKNK